MNTNDFYLYNDRNDVSYLNEVAELLTFESLEKNAIIWKDDKTKYVSVKFSGLSAMTLLGGIETTPENNPVYKAFINLISKNGVTSKLNEKGIYVHIKLLLSYPYSDFYYDLIQAERSNQKGVSIECIMNNEEIETLINGPKILYYNNVTASPTYQNLEQSLSNFITCLDKDIFSNEIAIKFSPVNTLCCFLQINNTLFIDSYLFAKNVKNSPKISLISPIIKIIGMQIGKIRQLPTDNDKKQANSKLNQKHYYSILSNFWYFWKHDLTLHINDVCKKEDDRVRILEPHLVSYLNKAKSFSENNKDIKPYKIDAWKQKVKDEFKKYTSKFHKIQNQLDDTIVLFIVGAWESGYVGKFMQLFERFINEKFSKNNNGLRIKPEILKVKRGENFQSKLYQNLRNSHVAVVIQTADIWNDNEKIWLSRPNVYLEKGYLMSHLGKHIDHNNMEKEKVLCFKDDKVKLESDNISIGHEVFYNEKDFTLQFYKVIHWLWEITELNSNNAISLIQEQKLIIDNELKDLPREEKSEEISRKRLNNFLSDIEELIDEIKNFEEYQNESSDIL